MEAMACGTPVIAFDAGGARELVIDGETGRLVQVRNLEACVNALRSMAVETRATATMGIQSRKRMEERFGADVQARRYLNLFGELLRDSGEKSADSGVKKDRAVAGIMGLLPEIAARYILPRLRTKTAEAENLGAGVRWLESQKRNLERDKEVLAAQTRVVEDENGALRARLARVQRNIGYRIAHGVTNALKSAGKIFRRPSKGG